MWSVGELDRLQPARTSAVICMTARPDTTALTQHTDPPTQTSLQVMPLAVTHKQCVIHSVRNI